MKREKEVTPWRQQVIEYTKKQEAEALERFDRNIYTTRDLAILHAMAKRTAEAEAERDALKARVAELERR